MTILAIATSGPDAHVGWAPAEGPVRVSAPMDQASRGRSLVPAVAELLAEGGLTPRDIRSIVVDVGPGSFTGVRLGVTLAKTLAYAVGASVVPVMSLDALAAAAPAEGPVLALRDAGRGHHYGAIYGARPAPPEERAVLWPIARRPAEAVRDALAQTAAPTRSGVLAIGEDAPALIDALALDLPSEAVSPTIESLVVLGRARLAVGRTVAPHTLVPAYLQLSSPEQALGRKV